MTIFGIGFNKTGTTSLHQALIQLGFTSLHWGGPPVRRAVERALREGRPALADIDRCDAYSDVEPLYRNFETIDHQYPGSRFILTERDIDEWIDSRTRHVQRNRERHASGGYRGTFLDVEPDRWRADFEDHYRRVKAYFVGRRDLLILRIADGDGYDKLCPFLGTEEPKAPFPWGNRDRADT